MKLICQLILGLMLIISVLPPHLLSSTIRVENTNGEIFEVGVEAQDLFFDVLAKLHGYFKKEDLSVREFQNDSCEANLYSEGIPIDNTQWNMIISHAGILAKKKVKEKKWRDYDAGIEDKEKEKIAFIVKTLAFDSLIGIGRKKNDLKDAGKEVDHVHPFRFLETIFLDEELKAGAASIRGAFAWVKDGFYDGITGSLKEESARKNLLSFVDEFSENLKIDSQWILPSLEKEDWKGFVNILIDRIPRKDPDRFKKI